MPFEELFRSVNIMSNVESIGLFRPGSLGPVLLVSFVEPNDDDPPEGDPG
jgi:hypothetical protein